MKNIGISLWFISLLIFMSVGCNDGNKDNSSAKKGNECSVEAGADASLIETQARFDKGSTTNGTTTTKSTYPVDKVKKACESFLKDNPNGCNYPVTGKATDMDAIKKVCSQSKYQ